MSPLQGTYFEKVPTSQDLALIGAAITSAIPPAISAQFPLVRTSRTAPSAALTASTSGTFEAARQQHAAGPQHAQQIGRERGDGLGADVGSHQVCGGGGSGVHRSHEPAARDLDRHRIDIAGVDTAPLRAVAPPSPGCPSRCRHPAPPFPASGNPPAPRCTAGWFREPRCRRPSPGSRRCGSVRAASDRRATRAPGRSVRRSPWAAAGRARIAPSRAVLRCAPTRRERAAADACGRP